MKRWLPHPVFAVALFAFWLLLTGSVSPGALLLGATLALAGSGALALLTPPKASLRRLSTVPGLLRDIFLEVVRSNNAVARIILGKGSSHDRRSGFVEVPLEMRSPYGLAALACILTATPGTVWVEYNSAEGTMLLHVLDLVDEEVWIRVIKDRWERRLMEIFE